MFNTDPGIGGGVRSSHSPDTSSRFCDIDILPHTQYAHHLQERLVFPHQFHLTHSLGLCGGHELHSDGAGKLRAADCLLSRRLTTSPKVAEVLRENVREPFQKERENNTLSLPMHHRIRVLYPPQLSGYNCSSTLHLHISLPHSEVETLAQSHDVRVSFDCGERWRIVDEKGGRRARERVNG